MLGTLDSKSTLPLLCSVWALSSFEAVGHGMGHTGHAQASMAPEPQAFSPSHDPKPNQAAQHEAWKVWVVMRSYFHISSTPGAANNGLRPAGLV